MSEVKTYPPPAKNPHPPKQPKQVRPPAPFPRLHARGVFVGYRRSRTKQHCDHAIVRIQGLKCRKDTKFYLGKRVVYVNKLNKKHKIRVQWGKVVKAHGNTGAVRCIFRTNLTPSAMGHPVRVM